METEKQLRARLELVEMKGKRLRQELAENIKKRKEIMGALRDMRWEARTEKKQKKSATEEKND